MSVQSPCKQRRGDLGKISKSARELLKMSQIVFKFREKRGNGARCTVHSLEEDDKSLSPILCTVHRAPFFRFFSWDLENKVKSRWIKGRSKGIYGPPLIALWSPFDPPWFSRGIPWISGYPTTRATFLWINAYTRYRGGKLIIFETPSPFSMLEHMRR